MQTERSTLGWGAILGLLAIVVLLAIIPLWLNPESEFGGADAAAEEALVERGIEPWFEPILEPPGGETESLLFALQAAIGAGFIGYYMGLRRSRAADVEQPPERAAEPQRGRTATADDHARP